MKTASDFFYFLKTETLDQYISPFFLITVYFMLRFSITVCTYGSSFLVCLSIRYSIKHGSTWLKVNQILKNKDNLTKNIIPRVGRRRKIGHSSKECLNCIASFPICVKLSLSFSAPPCFVTTLLKLYFKKLQNHGILPKSVNRTKESKQNLSSLYFVVPASPYIKAI